jgi:EAL domain-containing protein (putative c-di-GMP-specific phosphodiesterase class I)
MAINLSVRHIVSHTFYDDIRQLVKRLDIDLKHFIFEITEYELMSYKNRTIDTLRRLADDGCKFHLDDFGTGYSSITYLENLPIQAIKIDKTFVDKILPENREKLLVDAIVDLAHALNITTIAEGVENDYQFRYLEKLGCEAMQGYYFSRPLEPDAFEKLIENPQPFPPMA